MLGVELRAKPKPRARSARKMRAKPESRAEPEIERGKGSGVPRKFLEIHTRTVQSGVYLTVPAQELSAEVHTVCHAPRGSE